LYEKPGKGREFVSCIESGRHHNDTGDALRHIGNWIMDVAESDDEDLKKELLSSLVPAFNKKSIDSKTSSEIPNNLLIKIILKLKKKLLIKCPQKRHLSWEKI